MRLVLLGGGGDEHGNCVSLPGGTREPSVQTAGTAEDHEGERRQGGKMPQHGGVVVSTALVELDNQIVTRLYC